MSQSNYGYERLRRTGQRINVPTWEFINVYFSNIASDPGRMGIELATPSSTATIVN